MTKTYAGRIASSLQAMLNCEASGNNEWLAAHRASIESMLREHAPRGSGFDVGTVLDFAQSRPERLVFATRFHHMNEHGGYDGWTEHDVVVRPSLVFGLDIRVTGRDRNQIKDYIHETFDSWLRQEPPRGGL